MTEALKVVEIKGRKFKVYEPAGYEIDQMLIQYYDDDMNPIREKIPEANVALIRLVFHLEDEEIKKLPNSVYRRLLNEAAALFTEMVGEGMEEEEKK